jgi:pantetheine-phosphate adenylyltransferase
MEHICLFPGTFDPITKGHMDIILRGTQLFDKVVVGIGRNTNKKSMFSESLRKEWIIQLFQDHPKVEVMEYEGLTIDCCNKIGAKFILRGLRLVSDFEYEKSIADMNRSLSGIETVFLTSLPEYSTLASNLVRDILIHGGKADEFLPETIQKDVAFHAAQRRIDR